MEGQGNFVLPPEDNYNLPLDPYLAAGTVIVFCYYNESGSSYTITKDGDDLTAVTVPNQGVQIIVNVPNGDYTSSVEGTYTCSVRVNGQLRGTRDTIVSLPGKFCMQHVCISHAVRNKEDWSKAYSDDSKLRMAGIFWYQEETSPG